jgi:hypothetical protein
MFALLPGLAGIWLTLLFYSKQRSWRGASLSAAVSLGVLVTVSTEGLSLGHWFNQAGVCLVWLVVNAGLLGLLVRRRSPLPVVWRSPLSVGPSLKTWFKPEGMLYWATAVISLGIILLTGTIAVLAPPNNWDTLSYVMPRVVHWIQNQSVEHYPAHYTAQLYNEPWAEFAVAQLQLLSGGDRFANLLQWLSWLGCLAGVTLITQQFGGNRQAQGFAAVCCATIPVGILQASNAKNTHVIGLWLICWIYFSLQMLLSPPVEPAGSESASGGKKWGWALAASCSFGLAVLTKGTAYIYALPFILWLVTEVVRKFWSRALPLLGLAGGTLLLLNAGHYWRNFQLFGSPISTGPYKLSNEAFSIPIFFANVLRNISLHWVPPIWDAQGADQFVAHLHQGLGVDPLDPRLNWAVDSAPSAQFSTGGMQLFEDIAGNSLHFWLSVATIVSLLLGALLRLWQGRRNGLRLNWKAIASVFYPLGRVSLLTYTGATLTAFGCFCLLIKWQIWHSRLHLPFFVLLCPVMGIVLGTKPKVARFVLILLLMTALPYCLLNETRPLVGNYNILNRDRISQYFAARQPLQQDYVSLSRAIQAQSCRSVGLIQRPDAWEYPLWVLLNQAGGAGGLPSPHTGLRIENVQVNNPSGQLEQRPRFRDFQPCAVVALGVRLESPVTVRGQTFEASPWQQQDLLEPMQLLLPAKP